MKNNFLATVVFFDLPRRLLLVACHCGRLVVSGKSNIILGIIYLAIIGLKIFELPSHREVRLILNQNLYLKLYDMLFLTLKFFIIVPSWLSWIHLSPKLVI